MAEAGNILFIDDDTSLRTVVAIALGRDGHRVDTAENGMIGLEKFKAGNYDLVIQDVRMPGMNGLELLRHLREANPDVPVVVMTAYSTWEAAVEAMRLGAYDYIKKPFDNDELRRLAARALGYSAALKAGSEAPQEDRTRLIGASTGMREILGIIRRVARTDSTVMVEGESGSGKELVAAQLHAQSHRRGGPFIAVNCGGFSETLLESELFGHKRGAFTGAVSDKRGLLELADGGTFFLDEVGETSLSIQVRLLRVLETRTFLPVGSEEPRRTDIRLVTATNRSLLDMAEAGAFRRDLYYRLNVVTVRVPPLRERKDDVPLLAGYFLSVYGRRFGKALDGFETAAMDAMLAYDWPGNVRELENAVQRAVSLADDNKVRYQDIFPSWTRLAPDKAGVCDGAKPAPGGEQPAGKAIPPLSDTGFNLENTLADIESEYIRQALEKTGNNLTQAADLLGITFRSMRYKVKKLGLDRH